MRFINSYHNHTARCHHAGGEDEEYVRAAIEAGYKTFGFADHAPHLYKNGYVSSVRMLPSELEGYVCSIRALREKYKSDIDIYAGLELEYFPALFDDDMELYRAAGIEYVALAQHSVGNESIEERIDSFKLTSDADVLVAYVDQCIKGIRTGRFSFMAHPDVLHYVGDDSFYVKECRRLINAAAEEGMPLELNMLGMATDRYYPVPLFWRTVSEMGAAVIIGADAHSPGRVFSQNEVDAALAFADKYKLNLKQDIELRRII